MTDLGFGLADRRTVVVILFSLVIFHFIFGNPIPIDTTSASSLFVSLILFTGYIFSTRILSRFLIAFIFTIIGFPNSVFKGWRNPLKTNNRDRLKNIGQEVRGVFRERLYTPLFSRVDWKWTRIEFLRDEYRDGGFKDQIKIHWQPALGLLGLIDRVCLVGLCYVSTLSSFTSIWQLIGVVGLILLVVVYVLTGRYTFVLKDSLDDADEKHLEILRASSRATDENRLTIPRGNYSPW